MNIFEIIAVSKKIISNAFPLSVAAISEIEIGVSHARVAKVSISLGSCGIPLILFGQKLTLDVVNAG